MKKTDKKTKKKSEITARTTSGAESQLINMAMKLAEQKLRDGTASSQLITHFLKLTTEREQLEVERLKSDLRVAEAKIKHLQSQSTSQELYEAAIKAFKSYSGSSEEEEIDERDE